MTTTTATEDMINTADAQLAPMVSHQADIAQQIAAARSELDSLTQAHAQREQALIDAGRAAAQLEAEHAQAVSYAGLAHETPNQRRAIEAASGAKKRMVAAQQEVARLQGEAVEADRAAAARQQELLALLDRLKAEHARTDASLQQMQAARGQALGELGAQKHAAILAEYHALEGRLAEAKRRMVDAQVELHDFLVLAEQELAEWPDHQAAIARLPEPENPTSRIIAATLAYIETLLNDRAALEDPPMEILPRKGIMLMNLLIVTPDMVMQATKYRSELIAHKELLQQMRDNYQAWLRQHR